MKKTFITQEEFSKRRKQFFQKLEKGSIALVLSHPEKIRNYDGHYFYRQNSDFLYLTGFSEPEAIAVFLKDNQGEKFILFNRPNRPEEEKWVGKFAGQRGAVHDYHADEAFDIALFEEKLPELLSMKDHLYYPWGQEEAFDTLLAKHVHNIEQRSRMGYKAPHLLHNVEPIIHELRLFKSAAEIEALSYSTETAATAHIAAMKVCRPGMFEYEIQAELTYVMQKHGCTEYAYSPIVAGGENACTLHYITNKDQLQDGELVLVDAGCECEYYASDITRTYPVNGKFTEDQKALYNVVLKAQLAALTVLIPGKTRQDFLDIVNKTLTQGLMDLGILKGNLEKLLEEKAYRTFYYHSPGHWLGLDTHDRGLYMIDSVYRKFEPGMVITNEPGLYIASNLPEVDKRWWGIGIRIEDDILITETGNKVLTALVPKTVDEIEALMRKK
jgi:Xaa-Pro aminopeptidase